MISSQPTLVTTPARTSIPGNGAELKDSKTPNRCLRKKALFRLFPAVIDLLGV